MGLIGDAGAEHRHIQSVGLIVDSHGVALQARLRIVDAVPPAGLVEVILAAGPHEHGGLLRVSGNDGAALGVGGKVAVGGIAGSDEAVGILHVEQGLVVVIDLLGAVHSLLDDPLDVEVEAGDGGLGVLQDVGAGAHEGQARLYRSLHVLLRLVAGEHHVGLGNIAGGLEVHLAAEGEAVKVVVVHIDLRLGDDLGLGHIRHMGNLDDILVVDLTGILVVDDEVALAVMIAGLSDETHGDALGQQVIDGVDGGQTVVADNGGGVSVGGDPCRAVLHGVGVGGLTLEHTGLGDGGTVKATQLREVGDGLTVKPRPVLHDLALIQNGVGEAAADLVHIDDEGAGLIGHTVHRHVLGELLHLHAVADEVLLHEVGVGDIPLGIGIGGNDVVLRIELTVLVLFTEVGLHLIVLGNEPLLGLRGLLVVQRPPEELQLVQVQVVLVLGHVGGMADEAVLTHGDGGFVVLAALHRVADGAVEQRIGGGVVGGHIVGGILEAAGSGIKAGLQSDVVPGLVVLGGAILLGVLAGGIVDGVHGGHVAERPCALQGVVHEQVVLQIGLVGRRAGLDLQLGAGIVDEAVQLHQRDGLPLHQIRRGYLRLDLGLIGAVTVQVKVLGVATLIVLQCIGVLGGTDDEEHVAQHVFDVIGAGLVVGVLIRDGLLRGDGLQELDLLVHGGALIGVDVGDVDGDLIVRQLAGLHIGGHGLRIGLSPLQQGHVVVHHGLVPCHDDLHDVLAVGGKARGFIGHIQIVGLVVHDVLDLAVQLVIGGVGIVDLIAHGLAGALAGGLIRHLQLIQTTVGVPGTPVGGVIAVKQVIHTEDCRHVAVFGNGQILHGEHGLTAILLVLPVAPLVQRIAAEGPLQIGGLRLVAQVEGQGDLTLIRHGQACGADARKCR